MARTAKPPIALPPALWVAALSAVLTGLGMLSWLAAGGGLRATESGTRAEEIRVRDSSPELAAQSYYDALQAGRPDLARRVAVGAAKAAAADFVAPAAPRGRSALRVDESHLLEDGRLLLIGELEILGDAGVQATPARFETIAHRPGSFRVVRMELSHRGARSPRGRCGEDCRDERQ